MADDAADHHDGTAPEEKVFADRRWAPSLTVLVLVVLPFLLPAHLRSWTRWVLGALEFGLLVAIVIADPGRVDRRSGVLRGLSVALIALLVLASGVATATLVHALVEGDSRLKTPSSLLLTGGLVWLEANLTFALLYWELDSGGPARRLQSLRRYPDLAFVQQVNPDLAPPGWRPTLPDYLYLGLTNSLAFSPTDVMPLTPWAKLAMAAQSILSLLILSLVIANAVNLLG